MIKRLGAAILAACITVGTLGGCSGGLSDSAVKNTTEKALKKAEDINSAKIVVTGNMSYVYNGGRTVTVKTTSEYTGKNMKNAEKLEMYEECSSTAVTSSKEYENYYKDGFYYTTRYGGSFKTKATADSLGLVDYRPLSGIGYDDFKSVSASKSKDSDGEYGTVISFSPKSSVVKKYINSTLEDGEAYDSISVTDASGSYTVNADGYIVREKLDLVAAIETDGESLSVKIDSEITYSGINTELDPYDPEDDEYTELDDLGEIATLHSAMSSTMSNDSLNIKANIKTDVVAEKSKYGYEREYARKYAFSEETFYQQATTAYNTGAKAVNEVVSGLYYTDGVYYNRSDLYEQKLYSRMTFGEFYSNVFSYAALTPADYYTTGMMKDIKAEKKNDETVYSFGINADSTGGKDFFYMIFSAFSDFGGDIDEAEIDIKSFSGKSLLDKDGNYRKTEISVEAVVKFDEGEVSVKSTQQLTVDDIGKSVSCKFPTFKGYTAMDKEDVFSAGANTSSQ